MNDLIDAILAAPDDDAPRLVYADVLIERGDPQGEFIVVQCERARLDRAGLRGTRADNELARREAELLAENVKRWVDPVGLKGWWGTFERGFITHVSKLTPRSLQKRWEFFGRLPLESVSLRTQRDNLRARQTDATLAELAWVAKRAPHLKSFAIDANKRQATFAPALLHEALGHGNAELAWPADGLMHPRLWPATIELAGAASVATDFLASYDLPRLRALRLWQMKHLAPAEVTALSAKLAPLGELAQLEAGFLSSTGAEAILRAPLPPTLRELTLAHEHRRGFEPAVTRALIEFPLLPRLASLTVDVDFDAALVEKLATDALALRTLVLDRGAMESATVDVLLGSALASRLEALTLVVRDQPSAEVLLSAPFERLRSLTLDGFAIPATVAGALVDGLPTVNELRVRNGTLGTYASGILRDRWPNVS